MEKLKNIQLIVSDLDGTLLKEDKSLDEHILEVIKEKKIPFTFASGRNYHIIQDFVSMFQLQVPYITNNGANIYKGNECIYECAIDSEELAFCLSHLIEKEVAFIAYANEFVYPYGQHVGLTQFMKRLIGKCEIIEKASIQEIISHSIFKVVMIHDQMNEIQAFLNQQIIKTHCIQSENDIYTLTNKEATKGKALQWLLNECHLSKDEVLVFGDNYNDVSMFEVSCGVAVANAQDELKQKASYVTKSNEENGVSWFIEHYL